MVASDGAKCCCGFIFTLGLTALFMWLSLRVTKPRCSLQFFYLPAINKTLNSTTNTTLYFMIQLENPNKDKGIKYDDVNVTVYDGASNRTRVVARAVIPRFRQGNNKKAKKWENVQTNSTAVSRAVSENGTAVFRVDLATKVRFKIIFWHTDRQTIKVGANFLVHNGTKVNKKVKLKSSSPKLGSCLVLVVFFNFLVLLFLNFFYDSLAF